MGERAVGTVMHATKLVVRDVDRAEGFYTALGLTVMSRNHGGEGDVRQKQTWLAASEGENPHIVILSQFTELPAPAPRDYPGEVWLCFQVPDIDAAAAAVVELGGAIVREGEDQPKWGLRAGVVRDPEGHLIEIVGPIRQGSST
jgi:catechol 2,3-dioxygenase-like lactoylglutathione lyase family enzyme